VNSEHKNKYLTRINRSAYLEKNDVLIFSHDMYFQGLSPMNNGQYIIIKKRRIMRTCMCTARIYLKGESTKKKRRKKGKYQNNTICFFFSI
jgi:hypothetical protein